MFVSTVSGPAAPESLGITLPSEHLIADFATPEDSEAGWRRVGRTRPTAAAEAAFHESAVRIEMLGALNLGAPNRDNLRLDHELLAIAEAGEFGRLGGGAIVDQTSTGLGRNPRALRRIADATGLAVVMGAGWHHPAWSPELADRSTESLAAEIAAELEAGVDGIRAGFIGRIGAIDPGVELERRLLLAVAAAARQTGAPVNIARSATIADTLAVLDILEAEGVGAAAIALGDGAALLARPEELDAVLARGVYVQFDQLGDIPTILTEVSDHDIAQGVLGLAARGLAGQLLISQGVRRKIDLNAFGGNGYGFILEQYLPYLRMFGADDGLLTLLTEANPQRWLSMRAPGAGS
ncbi:phosphotriesterase [Microterricola gilva]|nr:phosphotriesterase [Microterricola gilva]